MPKTSSLRQLWKTIHLHRLLRLFRKKCLNPCRKRFLAFYRGEVDRDLAMARLNEGPHPRFPPKLDLVAVFEMDHFQRMRVMAELQKLPPRFHRG